MKDIFNFGRVCSCGNAWCSYCSAERDFLDDGEKQLSADDLAAFNRAIDGLLGVAESTESRGHGVHNLMRLVEHKVRQRMNWTQA